MGGRRLNAPELIARKRDGGEHTEAEIAWLLEGMAAGRVPDYQVAAWLMAVVWRGMTPAETLALTRAMVASGEVLDLSHLPGVKVDKHSTGGVGDKVTLIACPLAAACGVTVPKLSGRALAHTGGTLDKLESIPGFEVDLGPDRFRRQVAEIGIAVAAQSPRMVPADKALYALRDATGTVPSRPLIASSVMSKKIAAGADAIVLDVKFGRGAFMPDLDSAIALAQEMVGIGEGAGRRTVGLVTAMDEPLGRCIGNALEVREAIAALRGEGDPELVEVSVRVAREMCALAGATRDPREAIADGSALARFEAMVAAQGGRLAGGLPRAPAVVAVRAPAAGWVAGVDALAAGLACVSLGAGRTRKEDAVDPAAGVVIRATVGDRVEAGDVIAEVHARDEEVARAVLGRLTAAWHISGARVTRPPHVHARVDRDGVSREPGH